MDEIDFFCLYRNFCKGESKATNAIRTLISSISRGTVPNIWFSQYSVSKSLKIGAWIADFSERCKLIPKYGQILSKKETSGGLSYPTFWLGGLFSPEAFITASRQATAQVIVFSQ
jgi:dynein heavy chain 1